MPIVSYNDGFDNIGMAQRVNLDGDEAVVPGSENSLLGAAFRTDNVIGSTLAGETIGIDRFAKEDGFNPLDEIEGTKYAPYVDDAANIFNRKYFDAWKAQIDREDEDRKTLEAGGWLGTGASALAAILDLPSLIPGGAAVRGATAGQTIARTAGSVAAAGGVGAAASELGLQATQETRTATETGVALGSGVVFGGLLGAGVGAFMTRAEQKAATAGMDRVRTAINSDESLTPELDAMEEYVTQGGGDLSIGAAERDVDTLEDLTIAGNATNAYAKSISRLNPILDAYQSPSAVYRDIMLNEMVDNPIYMKKNLEGRGSQGAELFIKFWERGALGSALDRTNNIYKFARKDGLTMSRSEFNEAVGQAMRRGDDSDIPAVAEAASAYRNEVFEPLKQEAIKAGLLPKDVDTDTAMSYFHRVYKKDKIIAQEPEFRAAIRPYISKSIDDGIRIDLAKASKRADNLQREIDELEVGILRRQSDFADREAGGEIELTDGATEADVLLMVRQVNETRPPKPQSLVSFLRRQGLYDPGGDLNAIGINNRSAPGFVRSRRARDGEKGGGIGLDDAALRAWEEGFFPEWSERPTVREFLTALEDDFRGTRRVVREADYEAARLADYLDEVESQLARMGVDVKSPKFATSEEMKGFAGTVNRALEELDRRKISDLRAKLSEVASERDNLTDPFISDDDKADYIEDIIGSVIQKITGTSGSEMPEGLTSLARGPLKERTLHVPDEAVEGFLEDDVDLVSRRYVRRMAPDVELTRRFGRADMRDQIVEVTNDYERLRGEATTEKERANLAKRQRRDVQRLQDVRDMLRGEFEPKLQSSGFARALNVAQSFNFMRAMGGVTVSSLTDAARPPMVKGLLPYMRDGIGPLLTNLEGVKMSVKEARRMGAVSEVLMQSRIATMAELQDPYAFNSPFERFLNNSANMFAKMTGLAHWTDFGKAVSSVMVQNQIIRNSKKGFSALPKKERDYMAFVGIEEDMAARIAAQFDEHGFDHKGVAVANVENWTDENAQRAYRAAVLKDVDSIIVTKGIADVPVFSHRPEGRALLQFKTFALASNQRMLMRGMQEGSARLAGGVMGSAIIGAFIYWLKQKEAGREVSNNPGTFIAEGLDRSGIFAIGFEINNAVEKAGGPGVYRLLSMAGKAVKPDADMKEPASRFATRSGFEAFFGPTFGLTKDVYSAGVIGFQGMNGELDLKESDISTMRRLSPFASLPYWRWAIDGGFGFDYGAVPAMKEAVR